MQSFLCSNSHTSSNIISFLGGVDFVGFYTACKALRSLVDETIKYNEVYARFKKIVPSTSGQAEFVAFSGTRGRFICQTQAMKKWRVTAKALDAIPFTEKRNSHNKSRPIKLFPENIVALYSFERFGTLAALKDYRGKLENSRSARAEKAAKEAAAVRKLPHFDLVANYYDPWMPWIKRVDIKTASKNAEKLVTRFAEVGLKVRRDSGLCAQFIRGERDDLDFICRRMCEVHFLYSYTEFPHIYGSRKKRRAEFEEAEKKALKGKPYPSTWPWLE